MAEIGNGNICRRCGRESLGGARQRFLPSTGLSNCSDSADPEQIQIFYGYSQLRNNTATGLLSIVNGFFSARLLHSLHEHAIARAAELKFLLPMCQS